ncbi:MAG: UPF0489 family protein [Candidatus Latescibacteria bacterium]|nr:UPF0489 family protein [Candidatus Latescibacterota bacterium]
MKIPIRNRETFKFVKQQYMGDFLKTASGLIPHSVADIYPNRIQNIFGIPGVIFRDHRWTLPIIYLCGKNGLASLPICLITFDRHHDALIPKCGVEKLSEFNVNLGTFEELVDLVKYDLSPRDDDWIISGMELGLISHVIQFCSNIGYEDHDSPYSEYDDSSGTAHRFYKLGRLKKELSYKGVLTDKDHQAVKSGLWNTLGWDPAVCEISGDMPNLIVDIDCDYFTFFWDTYVLPFTEEIFEGEFKYPCQSSFYSTYEPVRFIRSILRRASVLTLVTEPDFCGGKEKCEAIVSNINNFIFDGNLDFGAIDVDYLPKYPNE